MQDYIKNTIFVGDTDRYKITFDVKTKQCIFEIPVKRAEDKTECGYTINSTKRYNTIRIVYKSDIIVQVTHFVFIYNYEYHDWCIDWNTDYCNIIRIEVK